MNKRQVVTDNCDLCGSKAHISWAFFKANVSYFVERNEYTYEGKF